MMTAARETLGSVAAEWDELATTLGSPPFLRPEWFRIWGESFTPELEIVTARDGGRLVGVLPVCPGRWGVSSPTNAETPFFGLVAETRQAAEHVLDAALAMGWHHVALDYLPEEDDLLTTALQEAAQRRGYRTLAEPFKQSAYVDTRGSWDDYLAAMTKKRRHELRRHRRRLNEAGRVDVRVHADGEGLDDALAEAFRIEGSGWKARHGTAITSQPRLQRFYAGLAHWAADRGWLRLAFLELDGRPIAFDYVLEYDAVRWVMKIGFDADHGRLSPGSIMRGMEIEHAFADGIARYEMLGTLTASRDGWKLAWASDRHELVRMQAFRRSAPGLVAWGNETQLKPRRAALRERVKTALPDEAREKLNRTIAPLKRRRGR